MVVANDPQPYLSPAMQPSWSYTTYIFDDVVSTHLSATSSGFVNGYFVTRVETTAATDVIAYVPNQGVQARSVSVAVDVFGNLGGNLICSFNTRFVRQRGTP
jgi:hypothetical protein